MVKRDDASLVKLAKQGDPEAFREIYEANYTKIYSYIYYRVSESATAEDICSEVFMRLVKKIDSYEDRGRPLIAWLYTIAGNLVRDHHRRESRVQWMPLDNRELVSDSDPTRATDLRLTSDMLAQAVNCLTEEQSQVIVLKFVEGKNNAEIAAIMDKREGSIKSLQHRALRALRRIIERDEDAEL